YKMLQSQSYSDGKEDDDTHVKLTTPSDSTRKDLQKIPPNRKKTVHAAREVGCLPVTPILIGFPDDMDDDCWVTFLEDITYFPAGCIKSVKRYFNRFPVLADVGVVQEAMVRGIGECPAAAVDPDPEVDRVVEEDVVV